MSDELKGQAFCQWCGSPRGAHKFCCGSNLTYQSESCVLRQEIKTLTSALHATWDKERFDKDGKAMLRLMDHEDFEKVRKAMEL